MLVKKRFSVVILLFIFYMAAIPCIAEIASVSVTQMVVSSQANVPELQCATSRRKTSAYQKRELVPQEIPDDSEVRAELNELSDDQKSQVGIDARSGYPKLERARLGEPYRVRSEEHTSELHSH